MGTDVKAWADSFRKLTDSDKTIQADEKQVEALFTKLGGMDHLAFTAGDALVVGPFDQVDLSKGERYWGSYYAVKHAHKRIRKGGSVTLTGGAFVGKAAKHWSTPIAVVHALKGLNENRWRSN